MILPIHVGRHQLHLVRPDSYKTIDCELRKISVLWHCEKVVTKQKYAPSNFNLEKGWGFEYSNQCKTLLIFAKFEISSKNPFHTIKIPFRVKNYQFMKNLIYNHRWDFFTWYSLPFLMFIWGKTPDNNLKKIFIVKSMINTRKKYYFSMDLKRDNIQ